MNILITGANGFLGRSLVINLEKYFKVYSVVRKVEKCNNFKNPVIADLSSPVFLSELPSQVDCVIHLAQSNQYRDFPAGAEDMRKINIESTALLLEWSRYAQVKKFIFTSTANVYGVTSSYLDECSSLNPCSYYAATKISAEMLVRQYKDFFDTHILRLFTIYGPGQQNMLLPNIISSICNRRPIFLIGSRGLEFTPIYIDDVIFFFKKMLLNRKNKLPIVTNICGDQKVDLLEVIVVIEKLSNSKAIIEQREGNSGAYLGDNSLMKSITGDFRTLGINEGLKKTINEYKK